MNHEYLVALLANAHLPYRILVGCSVQNPPPLAYQYPWSCDGTHEGQHGLPPNLHTSHGSREQKTSRHSTELGCASKASNIYKATQPEIVMEADGSSCLVFGFHGRPNSETRGNAIHLDIHDYFRELCPSKRTLTSKGQMHLLPTQKASVTQVPWV